MLILAFTGLLQSDPAVAQKAENQGSENRVPDNQVPENDGPPATKKIKQNDILATISQSGSTNASGYKVVIRKDGSATVEAIARNSPLPMQQPRSQPVSREFPAATVDAKKLRLLLKDVGDVSRIPVGGCAKSASFGTRTQITYAGKTSGDLQCIRLQASDADQAPLRASQELGKFVQKTLSQLTESPSGSNQ